LVQIQPPQPISYYSQGLVLSGQALSFLIWVQNSSEQVTELRRNQRIILAHEVRVNPERELRVTVSEPYLSHLQRYAEPIHQTAKRCSGRLSEMESEDHDLQVKHDVTGLQIQSCIKQHRSEEWVFLGLMADDKEFSHFVH
jgi:hypothetical protein